ncbi:hypothetical protein [Cyanobium sp. CH-040]|uniref:hypothetical protein n=1 Tax=Cyanobium sp. CH-040 TaxID=2823708 RepID=UPI0020CEF06D|nr:hypothetical protein [Cyanobium sp. CH-040]MCP9927777.1 hypothetical protein [Cyanobium sp. CH-040]
MELTEQQQRFLARRAGFLSAWPAVGAGLLALLGALTLWLWFSKPLLANPPAVLARLERGAIDTSTLTLMAGLLPLMTLLCLTLAAAVVIFGFAAAANERRYQRIIRGR